MDKLKRLKGGVMRDFRRTLRVVYVSWGVFGAAGGAKPNQYGAIFL